MPRVTHVHVHVERTEESKEPDKTYIVVDGDESEQIRWGPREFKDGDRATFNINASFNKYASLYIVEEDMEGLWNPDDIIGKFDILASEAGKGQITRNFQYHRANYNLTYEVQA